ncbi:MAG: hypothetical protein JWP49_1488 [Phenylobacterium sp.]|nr:hypothetical protein [Phenylobacterium sp.]
MKWIAAISLMALATSARGAPQCIAIERMAGDHYATVQQLADVAVRQAPLVAEIEKINNKATDPNKAVGPQLSEADRVRFDAAVEKIKVTQVSSYVLSTRQRDPELAMQAYRAAGALRRGAKWEESDTKGAVILSSMRDVFKDDTGADQPRATDECDVDVLLLAEELAAQADGLPGGQDPTPRLQTRMDALVRKYGVPAAELQSSKLSIQDRTELESMKGDVTRVLGALNYSANIEMLRRWLWVSAEVYANRSRDIANFPGDLTKIGDEYDRNIGRYSESQKKLMQVWQAINTTFPSEEVQAWKSISEAAAKK